MHERANRWLDQADNDLTWAAVLAEHGAHNLACFLSQQTAAKALKALLFTWGDEVIMTASVDELGRRAVSKVPGLEAKASRWAFLDTYYYATRYPDALPGSIPARVYNQDAATGAVKLASEIVSIVHTRMD